LTIEWAEGPAVNAIARIILEFLSTFFSYFPYRMHTLIIPFATTVAFPLAILTE
jgi:hypothetical protein